MDGLDVFTSESSPTKTKSEEITNDGSSWFTENDLVSDDLTASQSPGNPFENGRQSRASEKDKSTFDIFSNKGFSSSDAITKKREEEIAAKDADENRKIADLRTQAQTDLENWYSERRRQLEQKLQTMKNADHDLHTKALEKSSKQSCDWSKVIRLIDFTDGKQLTKSKRDLSRMKECIFNARRLTEKEKSIKRNSDKQ